MQCSHPGEQTEPQAEVLTWKDPKGPGIEFGPDPVSWSLINGHFWSRRAEPRQGPTPQQTYFLPAKLSRRFLASGVFLKQIVTSYSSVGWKPTVGLTG